MEWLIVLGVLVALAVFVVGVYNGLVVARNQYKIAFAQIDVQLTRRHDLIPNLVETAKGYMTHERETLQAVIEARNAAVTGLKAAAADPDNPSNMQQLAGAENQLTQTLGRLFALSEAYPDLKANQNFLALQEELTATEGRVAYARQFYNDSVLTYDNKLESFPTVLIAKMFNFEPREYFEADEQARTAPTVEF